MPRHTLLERIVEERVGQALVGAVSVAIDKIAEEIAREALSDDTFRRAIRKLVQTRSHDLPDRLLRNGARKPPKRRGRPRRARRAQ